MDNLLSTVLVTSFRVWRTAAVLARWTIGARRPPIEPAAPQPDRTDTVCHIVGRWPNLSGQADAAGFTPPELPDLPEERLLSNVQQLAEAIIPFPRPYLRLLPATCKTWLLTYVVVRYWLRCYNHRNLEAVTPTPNWVSDRTLPRYADLQKALQYRRSDTRVQDDDAF